MNVGEIIKALEREPNKTLPVSDIVALMAENPKLPVVAMVDSDVVADDTCGFWYGSFHGARIEDVCVAKDRYGEVHTLFRMDGDDEIFETLFNYDECGIDLDRMSKEEAEAAVRQIVNGLPWQKSICVYVTPPDAPPFGICEHSVSGECELSGDGETCSGNHPEQEECCYR